jgi:hypothetical protein
MHLQNQNTSCYHHQARDQPAHQMRLIEDLMAEEYLKQHNIDY